MVAEKATMVTLRNRALKRETPAIPNTQIDHGRSGTADARKISGYEQTREKRIKENLERMQKLGILDLSLKLKAFNRPPEPSRKKAFSGGTLQSPSIRPLGPTRRSSRLQNATPVDYSCKRIPKIDGDEVNEDLFREEGSKPEVYTEEHQSQLGNAEKSWTLFVDGYGKDGRRIYDPINGKTCHQCRQKTLGHRTHCSKCNKFQGQFCGDCLYMRYGEHVLEAKENPDWICPVCRGICNCSLCRQAKGWAPTGQLYKKVTQLGFKSVAHYLIQTQGSNPSSGKTSGTITPVSARRSLPFSDTDALPESRDSGKSSEGQNKLHGHECEVKGNDDLKGEEKEMHFSTQIYPKLDKETAPATNSSPDSIAGMLKQRQSIEGNDTDSKELMKKEEEILGIKLEVDDSRKTEAANIDAKVSILNLKKRCSPYDEAGPDSIAGRLKRRRNIKGNDNDGKDLVKMEEETMEIKLAADGSCESEAEIGAKFLIAIKPSPALKLKKKRAPVTEPSPDSIAGRLRQRRRKEA